MVILTLDRHKKITVPKIKIKGWAKFVKKIWEMDSFKVWVLKVAK
jgi:hypothetical protein